MRYYTSAVFDAVDEYTDDPDLREDLMYYLADEPIGWEYGISEEQIAQGDRFMAW